MGQLAFKVIEAEPDDIARIIAITAWCDVQVSEALTQESGPEADFPDHVIRIRDAQGRAFDSVRLEREPGTNNFTLVLLTEDDSLLTPMGGRS
jgi:hypothetical protein